jgi:hypothetical protein
LAKSWRLGEELATWRRVGDDGRWQTSAVELSWNFGGTLTELSFSDNQIVMAFFGTIVELWWNFGGTLREL